MNTHPLNDPLMLEPPPVVEDGALLALLRDLYGLTGTLHPVGGERDRNFRFAQPDGTNLLIRVTHPAEDTTITDLQTQALLHLEATDPGLPMPRVIHARDGRAEVPHAFDGTRPCRLRVLSWLEGEPLAAAPLTPARRQALGMLVARMDLAFRDFEHEAAGRGLLWNIQAAADLRPWLGDIPDASHRALATRALDRFAEVTGPMMAGLRPQLIHNDLNLHNVLANPAAPDTLAGVIDFGDILRAPLVQEVGTACAYLLNDEGDPLAGPAEFLAGYTSLLSLTPAEVDLLPGLIMTRMAMTLTITGWRSKRQPENATYILRNAPRAARGLALLAARDHAGMVAQLRAACRSAEQDETP